VVKEKGNEYLAKLVEILDRLRMKAISTPTRSRRSRRAGAGHRQEPLLLVLERSNKDRRWRFSSSTVADIPDMFESIDALVARMDAPPEETTQSAPQGEPYTAEDNPLRSPYHAVQHFLISAARAKQTRPRMPTR